MLDFSHNSELKKIGKYAFDSTSISSLVFPYHIEIIEEFAFQKIPNVQLEFHGDSKLTKISQYCFACADFETLMLPPSIECIEK